MSVFIRPLHHAATGYGTLSLHGPTLNNLLPKRVALLVDAACQGQLKVCDCNGRIKPAEEIIETKDKLNIDSPNPELNALSLYVKKQHLIEWGNANGDVFHIVDAPADVVEYGPKNTHGEFAVRGFVSGLYAPAAKVEVVPSTNPSSDDDTQIDTTNLVYWRVILYSNIKKIDEHKKASGRGIIKYLRGLKDKRIPNKGGHDELFWIDDNDNEQCVVKKTINNAASLARKLP